MNYARPLSSYGVGGPSWGSIFLAPGSDKPGMPFDSGLARLLGTLLHMLAEGPMHAPHHHGATSHKLFTKQQWLDVTDDHYNYSLALLLVCCYFTPNRQICTHASWWQWTEFACSLRPTTRMCGRPINQRRGVDLVGDYLGVLKVESRFIILNGQDRSLHMSFILKGSQILAL